ncbi:MAG: AAA family ATPase [Planctomycetota bacterium]|nr:MAG: AAA family ATPase [Planctomycetota bacterium]
MTGSDDEVRELREALDASPGNARLRRMLAERLCRLGRFDEALATCREGLAKSPRDASLLLALARTCADARRDSEAIVVLESLLGQPDAPAAARVLLARLRLREGDARGAVAAYKAALEQDPQCADAELSRTLGVRVPGAEPGGEADGDEVDEGRLRASAAPTAAALPELERPTCTFADVGGMDEVKREIELKIIQPLLRPELYRAYGKAIGGGILLYGPPGCGKTLLARATAGQVNARFLCVSISDVLDMWVGNSERNLARFFAAAREEKPSVLFFDEVDALGSRRNDLHGNMRMVVNQFLQELDGARGSNDGLLVLAATNAPWHLDPAFRRPGRFDRMIFVPPPDEPARASIVEVLLRGKPQKDIDFAKLAKKSAGQSGADLYGAIDRAVEHKLADALRTGRPDPLTTKDVLAAIEKQAPSTREWFATAKNYVLYANEGGVYDDVARWMKEHKS